MTSHKANWPAFITHVKKVVETAAYAVKAEEKGGHSLLTAAATFDRDILRLIDFCATLASVNRGERKQDYSWTDAEILLRARAYAGQVEGIPLSYVAPLHRSRYTA